MSDHVPCITLKSVVDNNLWGPKNESNFGRMDSKMNPNESKHFECAYEQHTQTPVLGHVQCHTGLSTKEAFEICSGPKVHKCYC